MHNKDKEISPNKTTMVMTLCLKRKKIFRQKFKTLFEAQICQVINYSHLIMVYQKKKITSSHNLLIHQQLCHSLNTGYHHTHKFQL